MTLLRITIPPDVSFNDLNLSLTGDGHVRFDLAVLRRVCEKRKPLAAWHFGYR